MAYARTRADVSHAVHEALRREHAEQRIYLREANARIAELTAEVGRLGDLVAKGNERTAELMAVALDAADAIAANAPLAVKETRRGVRELLTMPLEEAYLRQEELGKPLRRTADAREAQRAFVEKRKPVFRGE